MCLCRFMYVHARECIDVGGGQRTVFRSWLSLAPYWSLSCCFCSAVRYSLAGSPTCRHFSTSLLSTAALGLLKPSGVSRSSTWVQGTNSDPSGLCSQHFYTLSHLTGQKRNPLPNTHYMLEIWYVRLTCFTVHAYRQIISVVDSEQLLLINSSILIYIFAYRVKVAY